MGSMLVSGKDLQFSLRVMDSHTMRPIPHPSVKVYLGHSEMTCTVDAAGDFNCELGPGRYRFVVKASGYETYDSTLILTKDKPVVFFMLDKSMFKDENVSWSVREGGNTVNLNIQNTRQRKQVEEEDEEEADDAKWSNQMPTATFSPLKEPVVEEATGKSKIYASPKAPAPGPMPAAKPVVIPSGMLDVNFRLNNIIILIDRSNSMEEDGRFGLLKKSVFSLVKLLRPTDRVSIVAYGSSAEILISGASGNDKAQIEKALRRLNAAGASESGKGLKMAYQLAEQYFIAGGSNLVILATDGAVSVPSQIKTLVKTKYTRGIVLSVLGIKNDPRSETGMKALAKAGGGDYLNMRSSSNVEQVLIDEIKNKSIIRK